MLNYSEIKLDSVIVHQIGRRSEQEGIRTSKDILPMPQDEVLDSLTNYFFSSFKEPLFYSFATVAGQLNDNPMYGLAQRLFQAPETLPEVSIEIAELLYSRSVHPNIKSGELFVSYFHDLLVDDELVSGLVICKSETKDRFLNVDLATQPFDLQSSEGIAVNKVDKACLILDVEADAGYKLCIIDKSNQREAQFWMEDFLQVEARTDDYSNTKNYIQMTKDFVKERMQPLYETDKVDEAEVMNKSQAFFTATESFDADDYAQSLFDREELTNDFLDYRRDFTSERGIHLDDQFDVSQEAVQKQSRVFKSVLKLDKNFHVYIHGNREWIERGTDADGRKFYKIYYEREA